MWIWGAIGLAILFIFGLGLLLGAHYFLLVFLTSLPIIWVARCISRKLLHHDFQDIGVIGFSNTS